MAHSENCNISTNEAAESISYSGEGRVNVKSLVNKKFIPMPIHD